MTFLNIGDEAIVDLKNKILLINDLNIEINNFAFISQLIYDLKPD